VIGKANEVHYYPDQPRTVVEIAADLSTNYRNTVN